jgi:hypothetical protein
MNGSLVDVVGSTAASAPRRGSVVSIEENGDLVVCLDISSEICRCSHMLQTTATIPDYAPNDRVLVWTIDTDTCVIMGRLVDTQVSRQVEDIPESLVLEAKTSLTLKVGDGSITIREDGRILIKGKDLVSHAKRMNRIRGGSVQIN